MPEYPPLAHKVGVVGRDPEEKETSRGNIVKFSLAVTKSYGEGDDDRTDWVDVAVWNEDLQQSVLAEVYKGAKVAVEGSIKTREYEGRTYTDFNANRVGLVQWISRGKGKGRSTSKPAAPARQADDDDDGI